MIKPKMIIFDYGHTLCYCDDFDNIRGQEAVMKHVVRNKNNLSAMDVCEFAQHFFDEIERKVRSVDIEILGQISTRLMYEYLQLDFDIPLVKIEQVFWDAALPDSTMPNAIEMLDYLKDQGIRSGVISNMSFSSQNLTDRINNLLPKNEFEFVITSSEYVYRKPTKILFELALRKAELHPDEVWYCGDNTRCDVYGASSVGIFPVWFHSEIECSYRDKHLDVTPTCDHLYIRDWLELIEVLDKI